MRWIRFTLGANGGHHIGRGIPAAASVTRELEADHSLAGACARTPPQLSAATNEKSTMSERMRGAVLMIQGLRDFSKYKIQKGAARRCVMPPRSSCFHMSDAETANNMLNRPS